jgi:hypothetical protein
VTSHCGVLNPGPCPEVWAELVLTTQEENSLFGSAIHKAIGMNSTVHSTIQPFRTNYCICKVQYIKNIELSLFLIFTYLVFYLVYILMFSYLQYLRIKTSARAASEFDWYHRIENKDRVLALIGILHAQLSWRRGGRS